MKNDNKKTIAKIIVPFFIGVIVLILIDFFDLAQGHRFNWDFISVLSRDTVTVVVFIITYVVFNKYQNDKIQTDLEKAKNQKEVAYTLLRKEFRHLNSIQEMLSDDFIETFKKLSYDEIKKINLLSLMDFEYDDSIVEFAKNGIISGEDFKSYIEIRLICNTFIKVIETKTDSLIGVNKFRDLLLNELKNVETRIGGNILDE